VIKSLFSSKSYKERWAYSQELSNSIKLHISENDFDVVHFDTISLLQYRSLFPKDQVIAINHHNIESAMLSRRACKQTNLFKKIYFHIEAKKIEILEKKHCKSVVNLVVSDLDKSRLNNIVTDCEVEIIPNGVDIDYFKRVNSPYIENSLLWVGGLTWYPNTQAVLYTLKEIWPLLTKSVPDAKLFIIGRNPPESIIKEVEKYKNIHLLGFVDDIRPTMCSVSGFICPITDGGGTRLKVLNALALGSPLIATSMACEGVPVVDGVNVLLAETPEEFVKQSERLFRDSTLRKSISDNSRKLIEEDFDFVAIGKKLNNIFESISTG
jgi:glycosyltransferase involved in cell wall biosynthesis